MEKIKAFLRRKDIEISARRYGIDALGAMAQGLFCSLLIGTIINTIGQQFGIEYLTTIGGYATAMSVWAKYSEKPQAASTPDTIQKRTTTFVSLQPFFSKWWCRGAMRKMRFLVFL